jgi:ornithine--oxo-acid transaminase
MQSFIDKELEYGANNYSSLPVVLNKAEGIYVYDTDGQRYMDMMSAYSAVSLGHSNPHILAALQEQISHLGVVSRAVFNDKLPLFMQKLCELSGLDKVIPMNSGAEAVETALKVARKWGEKIKGVSKNQGEIIVCENNFHGRTLGIISFSSDAQYKDGFGPFLSGFKQVDFDNIEQLKAAINSNTVAFLVEPIQGEAGIIMPSEGYLSKVRDLCTQHNVLLILDEIQCGLSRTGKLFNFQHSGIKPDLLILGKALGGGLYPVSCVVGIKEAMCVITLGDHGSTFGGNALASAIGLKSLEMLSQPELLEHVTHLGKYSLDYLKESLASNVYVKDIRGQGLFIGIELSVKAKPVVMELLSDGVLTKDTHENTIRIAPPLVITETQMKIALNKIIRAISHIQRP